VNAKTNRTAWLIASIVTSCITVACVSAKDICVNCNPEPRYVKEDGTEKFPFRTIQQGIKAAANGDRIRVYPGTYGLWPGSTGIDFGEKEIAIVSTTPDDPAAVAATIIDGQGIRVAGKQGRESQIRGFTIRGRGIYLENSHPMIVQCVFEYNSGGAINCSSSNARIQNCIFIGNTNLAGGAISCSGDTEILHCTFTGNGARWSGGAIYVAGGSPIIRNCILWGNASTHAGHSQIFVGNTTASINYCDIQGGTGQWWFGSGNIDVDPLLTAGGLLRKGSPCIDTGTADLPAPATATDIQGEARPLGKGPDMGADEWNDIDADGLPDFWEKKYFGEQAAADPVADSDGDDLPNLKEYEAATDPKVADTDADNWNDGREVARGANPRGKNLYVDDANGDDVLDGRWPQREDASRGPKKTIQSAIIKAEPGETVIIAPGIYTGAANSNLDFSIAAVGERVITVQSENPFDPNVVAATVIDPKQQGRAFWFRDVHSPLNCVQGLTLRNGLAKSSMDGGAYGGAILFDGLSKPTVAHCTITGNLAMEDGGGLYGVCDPFGNGSAPRIIDCDISGNEARRNGGGLAGCSGPITGSSITENSAYENGGGVYSGDYMIPPPIENCTIARNTATLGGGICNYTSNPTAQALTRCRFIGNSAGNGGGMYNRASTNPKLGNCLFIGNSAENGGGMYNDVNTSSNLGNCLFSGNSARNIGGGMCNQGGANVTLRNCTFTGNRASGGGGIGVGTSCAGICGSSPTLTNCIFFANSDGAGQTEWSQVCAGAIVNYSCIQNWSGSLVGVGNIGDDPLFADPGRWDPNGTSENPSDDFWVDGDYHLQSQAGRWDPNTHAWAEDSATSPCIDAGDPNSPVADEPMPNGRWINMGAYGGTSEASMSFSSQ
jgi:predicted outer membrane repeat protein